MAWIENETIVRTEAAWWSTFRTRSIEFKSLHPEVYERYPTWDTFQDGWQKMFTPVTIPVTEESFGVVHGDAHNGNIMMQDMGMNLYT
jgi:aminoglycoside phosphotransferase (APT) family kinase protein